MKNPPATSEKPDRVSPARRAVITAMATIPAAALAVAAGGSGGPASEVTPSGSDGRQPVYRETDHMRRFYQRCRF